MGYLEDAAREDAAVETEEGPGEDILQVPPKMVSVYWMELEDWKVQQVMEFARSLGSDFSISTSTPTDSVPETD